MHSVVALSLGLDYYGVVTEPAIKALKDGRRALIMASDDDLGSFEAVKALHATNPSKTTLSLQSGIRHATKMFEAKPELMNEVIDWLNK